MIVVKIGGGAGIDPTPLLADLAANHPPGSWVLVHGGSDETNRIQEALGNPPRFVTSPSGHVSRFTDAETLDAFAMATGKLNVRLVEGLQQRGVNAVGLTGVSGRLLEGTRKDTVRAVVDGKRVILRGDHTGTVDRVNADLLRLLLQGGYAPVVTVPAISREGEAVNADADRAAAAIAAALHADALVILSNVPGLLRDVNDPSSLVQQTTLDHADTLAEGRFRKKLLAAREAFGGGVRRVVLAGAGGDEPLTRALAGETGTRIETTEVPA